MKYFQRLARLFESGLSKFGHIFTKINFYEIENIDDDLKVALLIQFSNKNSLQEE